MTMYSGETIQVRHRAVGYDGETLTGANIAATVTIWDTDGTTVLLDEQPMTYSATMVFDDGNVGGWYYLWPSPANAPGAYLARITATGAGINAWEFKTIRLRKTKP